PILAVANQVMADAPEGATKTLWSERPGRRRPLLRTNADDATQAERVCDSVLAHRESGVTLREQAVLFRAAHHVTSLELALGRRNIPYVKYGGCASWRRATSRTSSPCSACWTTRGTSCRGFVCSNFWRAWARPPPAE
ncbi:MAG: hypothetical protein ABR540_21315, partial [Acidimicrobiales bacterium]